MKLEESNPLAKLVDDGYGKSPLSVETAFVWSEWLLERLKGDVGKDRPGEVIRNLSEALADALSQSWPKNADSTFAGAPQININITAPPLPARLVRLSKFAQFGLFAKGSEPSRDMLESAMGKNLLPVVKCGGVLFVDLNRVTTAIIEQISKTATGTRYYKIGSFNAPLQLPK